MKSLITSIPKSGLHWLADSLGGSWVRTPWKTGRSDIAKKLGDLAQGHIPPFDDVLATQHFKIHLRRRSRKDQLASYAAHPHRMIPPTYIKDYDTEDRLADAIRIMSQFYPMMEPWLEKADVCIFYEDMCADIETAITPVLEGLGELDRLDEVLANSRKQGSQYRLGCGGIGQHLDVWKPKHYELYEELFIEQVNDQEGETPLAPLVAGG